MAFSTITGKIQDISAGTSARSFTVESYTDPSFDTGGTVTVNTQKTVTCQNDGTFTVTLHAGSYRVVVSDNWKRSVWLITVPADGLPHDITAIRVTTPPSNPTTYYTAAAIDARLAGYVTLGGLASADQTISTGLIVNGTNGISSANVFGTNVAGSVGVFSELRHTVAKRIAVPTIPYAASITLALDDVEWSLLTLAGSVDFAFSNIGVGRSRSVLISAGSSSRSISAAGATFIGSAAPTTLAANKKALLELWSFDGVIVIGRWTVQP